jgi:hypothetical protein
MVLLLTPDDILEKGLLLLNLEQQAGIDRKVRVARFRAHYGDDPVEMSTLWEDVQSPSKFVDATVRDLESFLWTVHLLKRCKTEDRPSTGIPLGVKRQLLADIGAMGGSLATFSLKTVCNAKEDIYGAPNSKLRRQIANLVSWWKSLPTEEFERKRADILNPTVHRLKSSETGDRCSWGGERAGVPLGVKHQLLSDIEANGVSLATFSLRAVCNAKEDIYGARNSKLRQQISNIVAWWRSLPAPEFQRKRAEIFNAIGTNSKTDRSTVEGESVVVVGAPLSVKRPNNSEANRSTAASERVVGVPASVKRRKIAETDRSTPTLSERVVVGVPLSVKRQLLSDIEANRGLTKVSLSAICNAKKDIYGACKSNLRRRIANLVYWWRNLPAAEFERKRAEIILNSTSTSNNFHELAI